MRHLLFALPLVAGLALSGCDSGPDCNADNDGDGIGNCAEADYGTNPELADSDGDGLSDLEEIECVSSPIDGDEVCYACGWEHNDPGDLESTGTEIGDIMDNAVMMDQCGEALDLWDLHGEYHILFHTAAW